MRKRLICTTAGNTLLERESFTYRRVSGNTFTPQKAKNVQRGDMVLYHKECIDKTLAEVEDYLMLEDARYRDAKGKLFDRNRTGVYVPKLRTGLWRGAPQRIRDAYQNLEGTILLEGGDFDESEYRDMNRRIQVALQNYHERGGPEPVTPSATKGWLLDTVAPADWSMFEALADINPAFNEFLDHFRRSQEHPPDFSNNLYDAYRLFMGIRRGIMRYIAAPRGRGLGSMTLEGMDPNNDEGNGGNGNGRNALFSLQPEIGVLLRYCLDEINERSIAAAVTDVKDIEYRIQEGFDTQGVKLTAGVITGTAPEGVNVKNILDIISEKDVVIERLSDFINRYALKRMERGGIVDGAEKVFVLHCVDGILSRYVGYDKYFPFKYKNDERMKDLYRHNHEVAIPRKPMLENLASILFKEVSEGPSQVEDPEKRFILPEAVRFYRKAVISHPSVLTEFNEVSRRLNNMKPNDPRKKEMAGRRKQLKKAIIDDYGVDPDNCIHKATFEGLKRQMESTYLAIKGGIPSFSSEYWEREVRDLAKSSKVQLFTPEEEAEILRQYGFQDLLDLSWI